MVKIQPLLPSGLDNHDLAHDKERRKVTTVNEVDMKIEGHIDKCELRYQSIQMEMRACNARLKRIEEIGIAATGAIILLLIHIILKG